MVALTFSQMKALSVAPFVRHCGALLHHWFMKPSWEKETEIIQILSLISICANWFTRILDRIWPMCRSWMWKVIDGIWHDITGNPTGTVSCFKTNKTRDITLTMCVDDLQLHSTTGWWVEQQEYSLPYVLPVWTLFYPSLQTTNQSRIFTEDNISQANQVSLMIEQTYSQLRYLPLEYINLMYPSTPTAEDLIIRSNWTMPPWHSIW